MKIKIPSMLTIFLIFFTIMTIIMFGIHIYMENNQRELCDELRPYDIDFTELTNKQIDNWSSYASLCTDMIQFDAVRARITQYASMILICLTILSIKVDYK